MDTGGNTGQAAELYGFFVFTSKLLFRWLVSNFPRQLAAQAAYKLSLTMPFYPIHSTWSISQLKLNFTCELIIISYVD